MFNRGTWLFSVLLVCMNVTAFALRPFFRFAARRAPVTKSLARKFSGIFFSAKEEVGNKTGAKDILDVLEDKMKYVFDLDLPRDIQQQVREVQHARVANAASTVSPSKLAKEENIPLPRQVVVGFMDIDPLTAAEKSSRGKSTTRNGSNRSQWLS